MMLGHVQRAMRVHAQQQQQQQRWWHTMKTTLRIGMILRACTSCSMISPPMRSPVYMVPSRAAVLLRHSVRTAEPHGARCAKRAAHLTPDLAADAERGALASGGHAGFGVHRCWFVCHCDVHVRCMCTYQWCCTAAAQTRPASRPEAARASCGSRRCRWCLSRGRGWWSGQRMYRVRAWQPWGGTACRTSPRRGS